VGLSVVILAAGQGTRMRSDMPKVLHSLAGKPLLAHVVETAQQLTDDITIVHGHGGERVQKALSDYNIRWVEQEKRLGTGHAVLQALPKIPKKNRVLALYGDVPLICQSTLELLIKRTPQDGFGWVTAHLENPKGLGRILRDNDNNPIAIIEDNDATDLQKTIKEINTGICLMPAKYLMEWLPNLQNNNAQKEYYLPDVFSIAVKSSISIVTVSPKQLIEIKGVNNKSELALLERAYQSRQAETLLEQGVTLLDPHRFELRGELSVGKDAVFDVNVVLEGKIEMGDNCYIGPNTVLKNVTLGNNVTIKSHSALEGATIADNCEVGPFARLRPGANLKENVKIGNFVEIKKSTIGEGSKAGHLTYLGDTTLGKNVNIGAGTITGNYDGVNKHPTIIEDDAFIGTNNSLIAPVKIGKQATTGAGSTINKDVPAGELAVGRSKQVNISGWKRPVKKK